MESSLAKNWILLAVTALALSGIFSVLLIVGRTSNALDFLGIEDYFKVALIIHVNLGVLVWLLAMTISIIGASSKINLYLAWLSTILITISGFTYSDGAFTNNYIPMFENLFFKIGIGLFLIVFLVESYFWIKSQNIYKSSVAALYLMAFVVLFYTFNKLDYSATHAYYEELFWGFGHLLQFVYAQILAITWLIIAKPLINNKKIEDIFLLLPIVFVFLSTIYILLTKDFGTGEYSEAYTKQMIWGGSLVIFPFSILLIKYLCCTPKLSHPVYSAALHSLILFGLGGFLAAWAAKTLLINGEITTIIPAHYHGSTIGITVAMMGFAYHYFKIDSKWANRQIWLYSIGQIMYIIGLAIKGGHGAARKTAGLEGLEHLEIVTHIMRWGGLFVLIGGLMFVWIVWRGYRKS